MLSAKFYTVRDIADLLSINEVTVRNLIKSGELRAIKLEREFRIAKIDLENFLNSHATSATASI
jgi:excisionase family DNA binding protein